MKTTDVERELAHATLQLLAGTTLLAEVQGELLRILGRIPAGHDAREELHERVMALPGLSIDWEKYDAGFRRMHPDFTRRLLSRAPDLTPTELRTCTMLRMNLKSREIAHIFCITESGVEFHRKNIRRKLRLTRGEKLPVVLSAI